MLASDLYDRLLETMLWMTYFVWMYSFIRGCTLLYAHLYQPKITYTFVNTCEMISLVSGILVPNQEHASRIWMSNLIL